MEKEQIELIKIQEPDGETKLIFIVTHKFQTIIDGLAIVKDRSIIETTVNNVKEQIYRKFKAIHADEEVCSGWRGHAAHCAWFNSNYCGREPCKRIKQI